MAAVINDFTVVSEGKTWDEAVSFRVVPYRSDLSRSLIKRLLEARNQVGDRPCQGLPKCFDSQTPYSAYDLGSALADAAIEPRHSTAPPMSRQLESVLRDLTNDARTIYAMYYQLSLGEQREIPYEWVKVDEGSDDEDDDDDDEMLSEEEQTTRREIVQRAAEKLAELLEGMHEQETTSSGSVAVHKSGV